MFLFSDNLPQKIKSHRSVGKNMVFSTPPTYNNGRFSSTGRLSSVAKKSTSTEKSKSPLPEDEDAPEVFDPETGTKKKLKNVSFYYRDKVKNGVIQVGKNYLQKL